MFTGIIQKQAKLKKLKLQNSILTMEFSFLKNTPVKYALGASVSINGICSTISRKTKTTFGVSYMEETRDKTTVSRWVLGDILNIEDSLKVGDTLDGHFVYGHVDTVGDILNIKNKGDSKVFEISLPKEFLKYVVYKGSVAIDGVSLTISKKNKDSFEVSLIPYTLEHTNLGQLKKGNNVNIETDVLGKYVLENQKSRQ